MQNESIKQWQSQVFSIFKPLTILRIVIAFLVFPMIGFMLGEAFILIFVVSSFAVLWLFPYWQPAYILIYKISGLKDVSPILAKPYLLWWRYITLGLRLVFVAYVVFYGIKILFEKGFCGQSFLC